MLLLTPSASTRPDCADLFASRYGMDGTPHYSLYSRPQDPTAFKTPGPGAYFPESAGPSSCPQAPKFSFGSRTRYRSTDNNPGTTSPCS